MLIDIHAKSSLTEGVQFSAHDVLSRAEDAGLDGVAFCETLSSARCGETLRAAEDFDVEVFIGLEMPTDEGILLGFTPDIGDFYLAEEWRSVTDLVTPSAGYVAGLFDELDGAVIAARPYDLTIPYNMGDLIFTLDRLNAVEVFNSNVGQIQCDFALEAASFIGVPTVGGSDAQESLDAIGDFATFFNEDLFTQRGFVEALRDSEYWAVQLGDVNMKKGRRKKGSKKDSRRGRGRRRG